MPIRKTQVRAISMIPARSINCDLAIGAASLLSLSLIGLAPANAIPSYARQTGQPCATCHTVFPELTPFGRRFKLSGYTAGGTTCRDKWRLDHDVQSMKDYLSGKDDKPAANSEWRGWTPPISGMMIASFTHLKKGMDPLSVDNTPFDPNDNIFMQEMAVFYGGQVWCDVGAFVQGTHEFGATAGFFLDNADVRWSRTGSIAGHDVIYGITVNNNPTIQDAWNSTPGWGYPYVGALDTVSPGVGATPGPIIDGGLGQRVVGASAYVFLNNMLYLEAGAYKSLDPRTQSLLGQDMSDGGSWDRLANPAPYWRVALEKNWYEHSLMVGAFGIIVDKIPAGTNAITGGPAQGDAGLGADHFTDIGFDLQYQYLGDVHAFTAKASYIHEKQHLVSTFNQGGVANLDNTLETFKISGTYIYRHALSFTGTYFKAWGTADVLAYPDSPNGKPNASGWMAELAWSPWMMGAPGPISTVNQRVGIQFTKYDEVNGTTVNASDNNTVFLYWWGAF